jgi:hypothetical protein
MQPEASAGSKHQQPSQPKSPAAATIQEKIRPGANIASNISAPALPRSTTPPLSPRQQPVEVVASKPDKAELLHNLAKLSICQPGGLLQEYLEYTLPKILVGVVKQHNLHVRTETMDRVRQNYLIRKFGLIWRKVTWQNSQARKAKARRQRFNDLLIKEAAKKKKLDREKDEILKAVEERKQLQAALRASIIADEKSKKAAEEAAKNQTVGRKRKSLIDTPTQTPPAVQEQFSRNHKRSRTVGSVMGPPPRPSPARVHPGSPIPQFSNSSLGVSLSRSSSTRSLRWSLQRSAQDETKTDFFRLLAAGIDPETPWVPLTASQVAQKEREGAVERAANLDATYNRRKGPTPEKKPANPARTSSQAPGPAAPTQSPIKKETASPPPSSPMSETEDLIRQLREAREEMDNDMSWFRQQNELMQKQAEQEEEVLRSSASSQQSGRTSLNGLPMVNGYEYWEAPNQQASMSRVERRIRATGARGLANRPYGQYAIPMSKRTTRSYLEENEQVEEIETNGTAKKRRKHRIDDGTYKPTGEDELTDEEADLEYIAGPKRSKAVKHSHSSRQSGTYDRTYEQAEDDEEIEEDAIYEYLPQKSSREIRHDQPRPRTITATGKLSAKAAPNNNAFARLQNLPIGEDEEEVEDVLEDDDDDNHLFYRDGENRDTEELYDEKVDELVEESEDDSEDGYEDDAGMSTLHSGQWRYEDAPTPNTQTSHVSSGVGLTADDPLELSD